MNVLRQELRMMRNGALVWLLVLCGLSLMYIAIYPTFSHDAALTKEMFSHMPQAVRSALNINIDSLLSFLGFFAFTFTNLALAAGIFAMHTGISVLSREQRSNTTDFLLTKPRSRTSLFVQKTAAGVGVIVAVWLVFSLVSFVLAKLFGAGEFSLKRFALLMVALLIVQVWLYVFGLFLTQIVKRIKSTIPLTLAATFGFFMIGMLGGILAEPKLYYLSPFKFFNFPAIAAGDGYELKFMLVATTTLLIFAGVAYMRYVKRDERAAV